MNRDDLRRWFTRIRRVLVCAVLSYLLATLLFSGTVPILSAAAAFLVAGFLAARAWRRIADVDRVSPLVRAADVVATNVALTLVLLEVMLSIYGVVAPGSVLIARDDIGPYRLLPSHDYGRLWTNSYGYPSRDFLRERRPGLTRVVLLGDSFAVGAVRQDVNFASGMERLRPDVEVYNFGVSAIGPKDYRIILETEALAFNPDVVLVALFVGNDLTQTAVGTGLTFEDHELARFSKRAWRLLQEWYRQHAWSTPSPLSLPQLSSPVIPEKGFTLSRQRYVEVEVERLGISRLSQRSAHEKGWTDALGELGAMRDACRRRGIVYAMAIIPDEFQVNPDLLDELLGTAAIPSDDIDPRLPQRRLIDFCRAEDIPCLDLLPVFEGRRDAYLPQDTHWNENGNLLAAEAIAPWLDGLRHSTGDTGKLSVIEHRAPLASR